MTNPNQPPGQSQPGAPQRRLTVIIRDEGPFIHLQEPPTHRSFTIDLTPAQSAALALGKNEAISQAFIEPIEPE